MTETGENKIRENWNQIYNLTNRNILYVSEVWCPVVLLKNILKNSQYQVRPLTILAGQNITQIKKNLKKKSFTSFKSKEFPPYVLFYKTFIG